MSDPAVVASRRSIMPLFHGLSAFPITPADEDGRVDTHSLTRLLGRLKSAGVDWVGLLGSTGIYAYLTRPERQQGKASSPFLKKRTKKLLVLSPPSRPLLS